MSQKTTTRLVIITSENVDQILNKRKDHQMLFEGAPKREQKIQYGRRIENR